MTIATAGAASGRRGRRPLRRLVRGAGVALLVLGIALGLGYLALLRATRIDPPAVSAAGQPPLVVRGARTFVGPDWISRERGLWELHLEGEPFAMGFAHARLGNRLLMETDDYLFREMRRYVPSGIGRFLIRLGVRWQYRHLADFISPDSRLEIAGQAAGYLDLHGDFLPAFHRMVFYHALHDITQGLEHSPLLGCTAFAAAGSASANGHLIVGRNFDFEGPEPFDRDKAVLFFKPAGKIPFASVAWAGMTGVVTGINAERIYVSINAARSDDKGGEGMPVELLVRRIMESARSIDDAYRMVKDTPVMVPDFYLVADGKTGESAVIERTPSRIEIRRARDITELTNHALSPSFAGDAANDRLARYLTSGARLRRLHELLEQARGAIDPARALAILRDKRGPGGVELGTGNRNALDAIIATHSVVVDATDLVIWVSQGPHLLGRYVGFDLRKELLGEARPDPPDLPPDEIAGTAALRDFELAGAELRAARDLRSIDPARAVEAAERAEALVEKMPEPHQLLGDLLRARGDNERAGREYRRFLELYPPYLRDVEQAKAALQAIDGATGP